MRQLVFIICIAVFGVQANADNPTHLPNQDRANMVLYPVFNVCSTDNNSSRDILEVLVNRETDIDDHPTQVYILSFFT